MKSVPTCILSNGPQGAIPLVSRGSLILCKLMRKLAYCLLDLLPQSAVSR